MHGRRRRGDLEARLRGCRIWDLTRLLGATPVILERVKEIMVEFHTVKPDPRFLNKAELEARFAELGKPLKQWAF